MISADEKIAIEKKIAELELLDPEITNQVREIIKYKIAAIKKNAITRLVADTMWAISREYHFGKNVAIGYAHLAEKKQCLIDQYHELIFTFGQEGPYVGKLMAQHVVPVLQHLDKKAMEAFLTFFNILKKAGSHVLSAPLKSSSQLIQESDKEVVRLFWLSLGHLYQEELSYTQALDFANTIPKYIISCPKKKRYCNMMALLRVIQTDKRLIHSFLDGMTSGLNLLSEKALKIFIDKAVDYYEESYQKAHRYLSLNSKLGKDFVDLHQVAVPFFQVESRLNRYIAARIGETITVAPHTICDQSKITTWVDGKQIYLPNEIDQYATREKNTNLYKFLTKVSLGYFEFGTGYFDIERLLSLPIPPGIMNEKQKRIQLEQVLTSEIHTFPLQGFLDLFCVPDLAKDLFNLFEHGRILKRLAVQYPGIARQVNQFFGDEFHKLLKINALNPILFQLYINIIAPEIRSQLDPITNIPKAILQNFQNYYQYVMDNDQYVEASGWAVLGIYEEILHILKEFDSNFNNQAYQQLSFLFDIEFHPDRWCNSIKPDITLANTLKRIFKEMGLEIYYADLIKELKNNQGEISQELLMNLNLKMDHPGQTSCFLEKCKNNHLNVSAKKFNDQRTSDEEVVADGIIYWYSEWDCHLKDYLKNHARVIQRTQAEMPGEFYITTLTKYQPIIKGIKNTFERLKPEGLKTLRPWRDGDDFDYRALIEFGVDRKLGNTPSERLYIKRLKIDRDIAVLLLIDLSKSTSIGIPGTANSVLDVEKEAMVMFCEALEIVGDTYGIAGFSSTGRLSIDYFVIKDFDDKLDQKIQRRIQAVTFHRSTRVGAAIRHGASQLSKTGSAIQLLLLVSDGYPNDVDYKKEYALFDTQKSVLETMAKGIHVRAITIANGTTPADKKINDLYGRIQHATIQDVSDLPASLVHMYSHLTRY